MNYLDVFGSGGQCLKMPQLVSPSETVADPKVGMQSEKNLGMKTASIPVLSFFSGLGLLDLGFHSAGMTPIWHNEVSKDFKTIFEFGMESFGINGPSAKIQNTNSIVNIGPNEILRQAFGKSGTPSVFGIIGGPPCPDFSVGGKNKGSEGERGKLSQTFVRRILELQPTFFVFENVPGLIRTQKHREFLAGLLSQLLTNYKVDAQILNSLEYGVPQDRERLIIVGLKNKWLKKNGHDTRSIKSAESLIEQARQNSTAADKTLHSWFPWDLCRLFPGAKSKFNWPTQIPFGEIPKTPKNIPTELMVWSYIGDKNKLLKLSNAEEGFIPYSKKFHEIAEGDVSRKCFKRLHRWRYSPAAAYGNNEVHLHPAEARRLTVREAMQIQTVPESFQLPSDISLSAKYKTIGNAVPVKLAQAIGYSLRKALKI